MERIKLKVKYIEENKKGMTLIETITSVAILSIIILMIFTLIVITIKKETYHNNKIRTNIYLNSTINFIENQLDISIKEFYVNDNILVLKNKNNTFIDIRLENNWIVSNKKVEKPKFKIDSLGFKKSGALLYVTVEIEGENLTRCLDLKSQDIKMEIFQ